MEKHGAKQIFNNCSIDTQYNYCEIITTTYEDNLPIRFNIQDYIPSFTGRTLDLQQLDYSVSNNQISTICGFGGIGKTELVRYYAWQNQKKFDENLIWINAETLETIISLYKKLALDLSVPLMKDGIDRLMDSIIHDIYNKFNKKKCLIIFDNTINQTIIRKFLPRRDETNIHVIITSQNREWTYNRIDLNVLTPEESEQFFKQNLRTLNIDLRNIEILAQELQYLPIALQQAATYINFRTVELHEDFGVLQYIKEFENKRLFEAPLSENFDYNKTVYTTVCLTVDLIKQMSKYPELTLDILHVCSYLAPDNIPKSIFLQLHENADVLNEAFHVLIKYSLLREFFNNTWCYNIHRLVQLSYRYINNPEGFSKTTIRKSLFLTTNEEMRRSPHSSSVLSFIMKDPKINYKFYFKECPNQDWLIFHLGLYDYFDGIKYLLTIIKENYITMGVQGAIEKGSMRIVKYICKIHPRHLFDTKTFYLVKSAAIGKIDLIEYFIKKGADPNKLFQMRFNGLHAAATNGHLQIVKFLYEHGVDLENRTQDGRQAIHLAAFAGHLEIIKFLLENGSQVETVNNDGETPLIIAAFNGYQGIVKYLLDNNSDINHVDNEGFSGLFVAAQNGHFDVVKQLIAANCNIHQTSKLGFNALHIAAQNGHLQIVEFLYKTGLDLNDRTQDVGQAIIHLAALKGHLEIIEFLLENGSQVDTVNNDGETPLQLAAFYGHPEVIKYLLDNNSDINHVANGGFSGLLIAAQNGHFDVVKQLIKANCNHQICTLGFNALHIAAQNGHLQIVEFLYKTGLDLNDRTQDGGQALHLAALKGHLEIIKFLLENGSQVNTVSNDGETPLFQATFNGHHEIVKYLLDNNSDINHVDNKGYSGLFLAAKNGHFDVVKRLIEAKCNIHQICKLGFNALHIAAEEGHLQIIKILYEHGLDLEARAQDGCQAIHLAAFAGHLEIIKFLLENGSQVDTVNNDGETPLQLATLYGHQEVVKYLVNYDPHKRNACSLQ